MPTFKGFNPSILPPMDDRQPWAVAFRSSEGFCTFVVWLSIFTDLLVYSIIVPVIPFRLEDLGYQQPSAMTGWLLVAYALGVVCATPPLAYLAEQFWSRRVPLVVAILLLVASQIVYMEAPFFWLMCLARVLQGISSAGVWVISFSLLCDTVPEARLGRQLGVVMTGLTLGNLIGPPLGGVLHDRLGRRSPFILCIILCVFDLVGRLLVMEKHEAQRWRAESGSSTAVPSINDEATVAVSSPVPEKAKMSFLRVAITLCTSKRALSAFLNTFVSGLTFTILEPTLPLRLQELYGFTSLKVGLIYLAAVAPSILSTILSGRISDKTGVEWVTVIGLLASVPWWVVMAIRGPLGLLIASLALGNFFFAATVTPIASDLAAAARELDGIGYAHAFGAFNFAYSVSTVVGPLLGGQIYTHVQNGWTIIVCISAGSILLTAVVSSFWLGRAPLMIRLIRHLAGSQSTTASLSAMEEVSGSRKLSSSDDTDSPPEPEQKK